MRDRFFTGAVAVLAICTLVVSAGLYRSFFHESYVVSSEVASISFDEKSEATVSRAAGFANVSSELLGWDPLYNPFDERITPPPPPVRLDVTLIGTLEASGQTQALVRLGENAQTQMLAAGDFLEGAEDVYVVSISEGQIRFQVNAETQLDVSLSNNAVPGAPWLNG